MEENNNAVLEGTTPTETATEPETEATDTATAPQEQASQVSEEGSANDADNQDSATVDSEPAPITIPVMFNHESRELSAEDASRYAQLGLKFESLQNSGYNPESLQPIVSKLDYLAVQDGLSREQFVEKIYNSAEDTMRKSLAERFGEDENAINEFMEFNRSKAQKQYEKMLSEQKEAAQAKTEEARATLESRLADEFSELKKEFPDISEYKNLPNPVKKAAGGGMNLMAAYLLHMHTENKKVTAAKNTAEAAAKTTTGSMSTSENAGESSEISSFLKGLWG